MGAKELAAVEVEGVFFVSCGVVVWGVESIEAVIFCFYLGAVGECKPHTTEDLNGSVFNDGEWVEPASSEFARWECEVNACDGLFIC